MQHYGYDRPLAFSSSFLLMQSQMTPFFFLHFFIVSPPLLHRYRSAFGLSALQNLSFAIKSACCQAVPLLPGPLSVDSLCNGEIGNERHEVCYRQKWGGENNLYVFLFCKNLTLLSPCHIFFLFRLQHFFYIPLVISSSTHLYLCLPQCFSVYLLLW